MSIGILFWILMLFWLFFGSWANWGLGVHILGPNLLLFVIILVLGWKVFGSPIHGG